MQVYKEIDIEVISVGILKQALYFAIENYSIKNNKESVEGVINKGRNYELISAKANTKDLI